MRTTTTKNPVVHGIEKLNDTHTHRERGIRRNTNTFGHKYILKMDVKGEGVKERKRNGKK